MSKVTSGFSGLEQIDELMRKIDRMGKTLDKKTVDQAVRAGAEIVRERVKNHPNIPVSNKPKEHARDNIEIVKVSDGVYDIGVLAKYFYLLFHEIGAQGGTYKGKDGRLYKTPDIPAKPFMRPSFENSKAEIQRAMAREIRKALKL